LGVNFATILDVRKIEKLKEYWDISMFFGFWNVRKWGEGDHSKGEIIFEQALSIDVVCDIPALAGSAIPSNSWGLQEPLSGPKVPASKSWYKNTSAFVKERWNSFTKTRRWTSLA